MGRTRVVSIRRPEPPKETTLRPLRWRQVTTTGILLAACFASILSFSGQVEALPDGNNGFSPANMTTTTASEHSSSKGPQCSDGLMIPLWRPFHNLSIGDRVARGLVYFIAMCYLFVGVSIVADRFMAAIEVITSKEKEIKVKKPNGEVQIVVVRVWNETVANLSLMALGSSAPEILLSIIEVYAKNFEAGDLGPGTIVGSAAFNLFMIIGLCVYVIPDGEVRKIKHLRVFFVTATWSIFAYVWLYLILSVWSYGVVEVWEGIVTFLFFPATVLTAYIADRRLLFYKYLSKGYRINRRGVIVECEGGNIEMGNVDNNDPGLKTFAEEEMDETIREFEENRREYINLLRELRKKHPDLDMRAIEALAREELANTGPKSRAFYRIQATRKLTGGANLVKKAMDRTTSDLNQIVVSPSQENKSDVADGVVRIYFDPCHYTVMENVGEFAAQVRREGGDPNATVLVDFRTEDGSANAGSDYIAVAGTLTFGPGETLKTFNIAVIDDDVFEEDEHFYIRLTNARLAEPSNGVSKESLSASTAPLNGNFNRSDIGRASARSISAPVSILHSEDNSVQLVAPFLATVMILDDDHCGIFNLADHDVELVESVGTYDVKVVRWSGARGRVAVPYKTVDGTAKEGKDYVAMEGEIVFDNNEIEKYIPLQILEEDSYEKDVLFYMDIGEPRQLDPQVEPEAFARRPSLTEEQKVAMLGRPRLGETTRLQIRVKESKEFKNTVDKLVQRANASLVVGSSSWKEQFIEAITVNTSDDDDEDGEAKMPSCGDYVLHFLTLFWKILFAFVPPTDMSDGYVAFVVSILLIGVLTAVIGDLASHMGCTVGLKDTVTAVAFVALGTSIPDKLGGWLCFVVSITWIGILTAVIGDVASAFGCSVGLLDSVTAIAFVALGTSVPDTFASKVAAVQDKYADASVGNVTGSNAVNVFLGIGIAWSIGAIYKSLHGEQFIVPVGSLAFSVTLFCTTAALALGVMMLRRSKKIGGELGGPRTYKLLTSALFVILWLFYVLMSSLEAYGYIEGF